MVVQDDSPSEAFDIEANMEEDDEEAGDWRWTHGNGSNSSGRHNGDTMPDTQEEEEEEEEASTSESQEQQEHFYHRYYSMIRDNPNGVAAWFVSCFALRSKRLQMKEEDLVLQLSKYAELIQKLRNFHEKHILNVTAMLNEGNERIAKSLLMQLCQRLYSSGAPLWVLQPVMGRVAKGLLGGKDNVEFVLYSKEGFGTVIIIIFDTLIYCIIATLC